MSKDYESKIIDTSRDTKVWGFSNVGFDNSRKWARILLTKYDKTELPLVIPIDLVEKILPILAKLVREAKSGSGSPNRRTVFPVRKGSVAISKEEVVFDFTLPEGPRFAFAIDREGAQLIQSSLTEILGLEKGPQKKKQARRGRETQH